MQVKNIYMIFFIVTFWFLGSISNAIAKPDKFVCDKAGVEISVNWDETEVILTKPSAAAGKDWGILAPISWRGSITYLRRGEKHPMQVIGDGSVIVVLVEKDTLNQRYDYVDFAYGLNKITIV